MSEQGTYVGENRQRLWWELQSWLHREAELLDDGRFDEWLELLSDEISYQAPVRLTKELGQGGENAYRATGNQYHFLEDRHTLGLRVARLKTDFAWAEDPPSRTRRFVTNVRVREGVARRGGGAQQPAPVQEPGRRDRRGPRLGRTAGHARDDGSGWRLVRRLILIDQAALGTKNLGIML